MSNDTSQIILDGLRLKTSQRKKLTNSSKPKDKEKTFRAMTTQTERKYLTSPYAKLILTKMFKTKIINKEDFEKAQAHLNGKDTSPPKCHFQCMKFYLKNINETWSKFNF